MEWLYRAAIAAYGFGIRLSAPFNRKAQRWIAGRRGLQGRIAQGMAGAPDTRLWVHCASLGEYELCRPLLRRLREVYPGSCIVLTFFSPSGYEQVKDSATADHVFYLPADSPRHAAQFLDEVRPAMAFFIKNDFWHYYTKALRQRSVPFFIVSARFYPSQPYFRKGGGFFTDILRRASKIFVTDQRSLALLQRRGLATGVLSGDMRFDAVLARKAGNRDIPGLAGWCRGHRVLVAGSTWPPDEAVIVRAFAATAGWKLVIAPHEIHAARLASLERTFRGQTVRYSALAAGSDPGARVLLIDNIGMLADLYRYGRCAWVGGAFGRGLHNILEPVAYGLPVFFGPRIGRFPEAQDLVKGGSAFAVRRGDALTSHLRELENESSYAPLYEANLRYAESHAGALEVVMSHLAMALPPGPAGRQGNR